MSQDYLSYNIAVIIIIINLLWLLQFKIYRVKSIRPSIIYTASANPIGYNLDRSAVHYRDNIPRQTSNYPSIQTYNQFEVSTLVCTTLDGGRKLEYLEKKPTQTQRKHANLKLNSNSLSFQPFNQLLLVQITPFNTESPFDCPPIMCS